MVQPEMIVLLGAGFWAGAALVTGLPKRRIPSEFPMLFAAIAVIGSVIGVTELLPESLDVAFTILAVVLYVITPIVFTAHLLNAYSRQ
jgi:hypothetical protein